MLNKSLFTFRVRVPRRVIVDVHPVVMASVNRVSHIDDVDVSNSDNNDNINPNTDDNALALARKVMFHAVPLRGNWTLPRGRHVRGALYEV